MKEKTVGNAVEVALGYGVDLLGGMGADGVFDLDGGDASAAGAEPGADVLGGDGTDGADVPAGATEVATMHNNIVAQNVQFYEQSGEAALHLSNNFNMS